MIEVRRRSASWCVYLHGRFISDHATHTGASAAAQNIERAEAEIVAPVAAPVSEETKP